MLIWDLNDGQKSTEEATVADLCGKNHTDCSSVCSLLPVSLERELFTQSSSLQQQCTLPFLTDGTGKLQIYLEQSSFRQAETRFQPKSVQIHTAIIPVSLLLNFIGHPCCGCCCLYTFYIYMPLQRYQ